MWKKILFIWLTGLIITPQGRTELKIAITQGQVAPTVIAVTSLYSPSATLSELGAKITQVVTEDLERSGLFKPLNSASFIQDSLSLQQGPRYPDWSVLNTQILTQGNLSRKEDGRVRVEFKLFDVISKKEMGGWAFTGTETEWRRIAHKMADLIYKRITGEEGYFDTKIVYVSKTGNKRRPVTRLVIMDQDGYNPIYLTTGQSLVLTPRFSPNLQQITYLDFTTGKSQVWLMNTHTRKKELIGHFRGMTFAPRFSPDGTHMVMSYAQDGVTSLYTVDLGSRTTNRLTFDPVIDTSPSYSPDGSQICFNSDRGGKTQIYVMPATGGTAQRISFSPGSYRTPVWSPRGDLIAFVKITEGAFYLGVMRPDGSGERLLTQGWVIDDPCWSPNGRVLMFTRQYPGGKSRSFTIDLTGFNEKEVPTQTDSQGATWSPLIP